MKFWWVNQNKTYDEEVGQGFLWSPKTSATGARLEHYDAMTKVKPEDVVFSFKGTYICAVGVAQRPAVTSPKPFSGVGDNWNDEGWKVDVEFRELEKPFKAKDFIDLIAPLLPDKYSPIQKNGNGNMMYLAEIPPELGDLLLQLANLDPVDLHSELNPTFDLEVEQAIEEEIRFKNFEGDTFKIELVKSRRGQGVFKTNVRAFEFGCRVTGVTNIKHLTASHIKPWRVSTDSERVDGSNGLLLSPHIDHLFDRGFLSFRNTGELLIASQLKSEILRAWSVPERQNVGKFRESQAKYLEYHRDVVFAKRNH